MDCASEKLNAAWKGQAMRIEFGVVDEEDDAGVSRAQARAGAVCARSANPEERLRLAVLEEAVRTLMGSDHSREVADARLWFLSDSRLWPFSYRNLCDALGVDAARLRARLAAWLFVPGEDTDAPLTVFRAIGRHQRGCGADGGAWQS
jgi:hypothetical protein